MAKRRTKKKSKKIIIRNIVTSIVTIILILSGAYTYTSTEDVKKPSAATSISTPSQLNGEIVRVSDGDTVVLLDSVNTQYKIRLHGIDCPEKAQDYGTKATNFTKKFCSGKQVHVEVTGIDRYKRVLGIVWVGNQNLNEELLKDGLAWQYKYNKSKQYKKLEEEARAKKLNIWSVKNPLSPWDFRAQKKTK